MTVLLIVGSLVLLLVLGSLCVWALVHNAKSDDRAFDEFTTLLVLLEQGDPDDHSLPRAHLEVCVPGRADDGPETVQRLLGQKRIELYHESETVRARLSRRTAAHLRVMDWRKSAPVERLMEYENYLKYSKAKLRAEELREARAA